MSVQQDYLNFLKEEALQWAKDHIQEHLYVYGTITEVNGTLVRLIRSGETVADSQFWPTLGPWTPEQGQMVFCARADKGLVVLGPINLLLASSGSQFLNYIGDTIQMATDTSHSSGTSFTGVLKFDAGRFIVTTTGGVQTFSVDGASVTKIPFRGTFQGIPYIYTQVEKVTPNTLDAGSDLPLSIVLVPKTDVELDGFTPIYQTDSDIINETISVAWLAVGV